MLEKLNREIARAVKPGVDLVSGDRPARVMQFGTGGFLRGFADYFFQKAAEQGRLDGTVVIVGSTGSGRVSELSAQEGLYTLVVRGKEAGATIDDAQIVSVVRGALSAVDQWNDVLAVARSPELTLIVSNTTEVGIVLDESDSIEGDPPRSFPGKLTAVLLERAQSVEFDRDKGVTVLPCELIDGNGDKLRDIVLTLATDWNLGDEFVGWVSNAVTFCNTLVDRIVSGTPRGEAMRLLEERLGYQDALLTVAEPYRLWAIEGDEAFAARFPLAGVDSGIVVTRDVEPYRERKVRILNGTHTAMVPAAILAGLDTVFEAIQDTVLKQFIERLTLREIVPTLDSDPEVALDFAGHVLERFSNPFIRHELVDITFQQTRKFGVRVVPSLTVYLERFGTLPAAIVFGLASLILYNHPTHRVGGARAPKDDARDEWDNIWMNRSPSDAGDVRAVVSAVCGNESMWGRNLAEVAGLTDALVASVLAIEEHGVRESLGALAVATGN